MVSRKYDYIIVGAGSAGCVLASRLGEDPSARILLLEAGPADHHWSIHMPAGVGILLSNDRYNWNYRSEPEPHLDNRLIGTPRGRTLGGSSSINGMVCIRGHARDYDAWAAGGCAGWSYREVLPYFIRSETHDRGANAYHGDNGPLHVTSGDAAGSLDRAFIEAGLQAGYGATDDFNGYRQEGFGRVDRTTRNGRRWSTACGYLAKATARGNVDVLTGALVSRVVFSGTRAVGVEYSRVGEAASADAEREVILCAGAINTPQLLQLSGVGDADDLHQLGLPVVQHLPGVGRRLCDHPDTVVSFQCSKPVSIYPWAVAPGKWLIGARWFLTRAGLASSNQFESGAFIRTRAGVEHPDVQLTFMPLAIVPGTVESVRAHAFQVHIDLMRPASFGRVSLRSADPGMPPKILFNYLQAEQDRADMRAAARLVREIVAQKAFSGLVGDELSPGKDARDDASLDAWARKTAETGYHAAGTCKMGAGDDVEAVVDPQLRVHGLEGLRVVDASIMPALVSGNTNAPTVMIAEKASDMIRQRQPLAPSDAPVWIHPQWQSVQR